MTLAPDTAVEAGTELGTMRREPAFGSNVTDGRTVVVVRGDTAIFARARRWEPVRSMRVEFDWVAWKRGVPAGEGTSEFIDGKSRRLEMGGISVGVSLSGQGEGWFYAAPDLRTWFDLRTKPRRPGAGDGIDLGSCRFLRFDADTVWRVHTGPGPAEPGAGVPMMVVEPGSSETDRDSAVWGDCYPERVSQGEIVVAIGERGMCAVRFAAVPDARGAFVYEYAWTPSLARGDLGSLGAVVGEGRLDVDSRFSEAQCGPFRFRVSAAPKPDDYAHFDLSSSLLMAVVKGDSLVAVRPIDGGFGYSRDDFDAVWRLR